MSKKEQTTQDQKEESTALTTAQPSALATNDDIDYSQYAGAGIEQADKDSFAIPFLMTLQKGSPQVDEASGQALEGAKAGMLYDNVSQQMYDGKEGILIVPCNFRRTFIRWGAENGGEGFKGELTPEAVADMRESGDIVELENRLYVPMSDGTVHEKKCDRISDTRNHYVLIIDPVTGHARPALISLSSTQIKKSKSFISNLNNVKFTDRNGAAYTPPTFASVYRMTTVPEQNDKGTWYGVSFSRVGNTNKAQFDQGKAFYDATKKGTVEAKYEAPHSANSDEQSDKL